MDHVLSGSMSARSSKLSADAPAWYPSTVFEATIEACPAAEPPSVAEEAKQAPVSPASSSDTVALQASVDSRSDGGSASDFRESLHDVEVVGRGEEPERTQIPTRGASAGATVAPISSYTGLVVTPRDVTLARDFPRAEVAESTANRTGLYEEQENDGGRKEKGDESDGSTHTMSDPDGSDDSGPGATSTEGRSSSTGRRRVTRGQLWGFGVAALGVVVLVVHLSRRRRTG